MKRLSVLLFSIVFLTNISAQEIQQANPQLQQANQQAIGLYGQQHEQRIATANSSSNGCDNTTFVRIFGEAGTNDEGLTIVPTGDGNLYMGGRSGSQTLIIKMDLNGDPIWQRGFDFTSKDDLLSQLYVDTDGNLVGCGYGEDGSVNFTPYVFKYDPVADAVLWSWNYSNSSRCFNILEPVAGGDYIVTMDMRSSPSPGAFEDAILREIDRNTGAMTGNLATSYNFGSSETFSNTIMHNGDLFTTGRYTFGGGVSNMRHSISRLDASGNEIWNKMSHVSQFGSARLYGRDMLIENDEIISIASGDDDGGSATITNFFLQKNDLNGNIIWTKKYDVPSMQNEWTEEIVSTADGFLMLGYNRDGTSELFIVKTDKDGNVMWAKSYGDSGNESLFFTCESQMLALGNFIYFTAWSDSFSGSRDAILVKTDSDGNLEDDCLLDTDIEVIMTEVDNPANTDIDMVDYTNPQSEINFQSSPETADLPFQDLEGCACVPEEECDTTFLKTYGTVQDNEDSRAIASVPDALGGGFLLGGGKADSAMITWVDAVGDIIWTRSFDATSDADDYVTDLIFDSDNIVAGVGQTKNEPANNRECFIFRYDMSTNTMLWINELDLNDPANETYVSIIEKETGGNYIVSGQTDDFIGTDGCNGILVEVDRNSGANQWQRNWTFGSCETFSQIISADGAIFATGRYNFDGGGTARMRPGVSRFDTNGDQDWSRMYLEPVSFSDNARLYSVDLVEDNDGLIVFGHGDADGTSTVENELFLYRIDFAGNIEWARQYDFIGTQNERGRQLVNLPDGYLCLGIFNSGDTDAYIFKTDKMGNVQWAKSYGTSGEAELAFDMLWQSGQVFFTGLTTVGGVNEDVFLANISDDGSVTAQDSCNLFADIEMIESDWPNPYDGQHDLEDLSQQWGNFVSSAIMGETAVQSTVECFVPCLDSCDLLPEAVYTSSFATCGGEGILLSLEICNTGDFELPIGTSVTIYDADPTVGSANVVTTLLTDKVLGAGECDDFDFTFSGQPNTTYYVLINDDGTAPTPIDLTTFEGVIEECDYTNNIGSFFYDFEAPVLDLGPDVSTCENLTETLDAGFGFVSYEWNDGSDEQTLVASSPGTYSVTVMDECGGMQSDEITVSIDPASVLDMGPDQTLCSGGVIEYDLGSFFFDTYEWTPTDGVNCLNPECSQVEISPTQDITYTVVASNADGCFSEDSFSVTVSEGFEIIEDISICEGDTAIVFGEPITETGEFTMTFTTSEGCDSIVTISVGVIDTIITEEEVLLCWGDSVEVFGEIVYGGGPYSMTFMSENGCDSTHIISIVGHPKIFILPQVIHVTCFGGSDGAANANVLGGGLGPLTYEWNTGATTPMIEGLMAGTYTVTVTDGFCPEEAEFVVSQPDEIMLSLVGTDVSCSDLGAADVSAMGGTGGFTYLWSTGETGNNITGLEAGIYSVTATDANECTAEAEVEIQGELGPTVSITIDGLPTEIEPNGGALTANVLGGTSPFDYAWSNGAVSASQDGLPSGEYTVIVTDANGCTAEATVQIYLAACTGGKIWNDLNRDGCQDGGELGIAGIELELNGIDSFGNVVTMTTTTALNGEYIFEPLAPGDYQVTLPLPAGYSYSPVDACSDDFTDSDFDMSGLSYTVNLTEGHCCLVVDGGLYDSCNNVYDPGEICCDQILCGPGNDPAPINSVSPAEGASPVEYMWMYTTEMGAGGITFANGQWMGIPGTNSPSYDSGPIQETTYFARCVRAVGCTEWLETNVVEIFVDDVAVAEITPPVFICVGNTVTFEAADNPAGASYAWYFGPSANPSTSNAQSPSVVFTENGYPNVTLTVIYNDCTSTDNELIAVSSDPVYCGTAIQNPGGATTATAMATGFTLFPNPATDYVTLRWSEVFEEMVSIELMAVDGRQILRAEVDGNSQFYEADLSKLVSGFYILNVKYGDGEAESFRVMKE